MLLEFDRRSQEILRHAVEAFITSGEPVGSRTLSKVYGLSSATIRNVMSDLEELGFLFQPHTSAGRVPTDKGYRFYVDTVRGTTPLSASERQRIGSSLRRTGGSVDELMQTSSHLLAEMADTVSFVIAPDFKLSSLRHVDFVQLSPRRILMVLVSETGQVTNRVIEVDQELPPEELRRSARYLEEEFQGFTLAEARELILARMREERATYDRLLQQALALGHKAFSEEISHAELYLDGAARVLGKPEFSSNIERARQLLTTLEERGRLVAILSACLDGEGLQIVIGSEAPVPDFQDLALIATRYRWRDRDLGSLGVMGPTRMEYAKLISIVSTIARSLSEAMSERRSASSH
jgi:heat-inducible transcriptional repressor